MPLSPLPASTASADTRLPVAILAGGKGSRLGGTGPKPLAEIGGKPLIWHVMAGFRTRGHRDCYVALGHQGDQIRRYFADHTVAASVTLVDTGEDTMTGGRIKRLRPHIGERPFILAWSDGLSDIDPTGLVAFHRRHGRLATVVAVAPPPRFGRLTLDGDRVTAFAEKPVESDGWINAGIFVLQPAALDRIDGDDTAFEREPLERLAEAGELMAYRHRGFWDCVDLPADLARLQAMWDRGDRPWVVPEKAACASS